MAWTDEQLRQLGRISALFGTLELTASSLLMGFLGEDQQVGQIVVADAMLAWKTEKLSAFAEFVVADGEASSALLDWVRTVDGVRRDRNRLAHAAGFEAEDGGDVQQMGSLSIRGSKKGRDFNVMRTHNVDAATLEALAERIKTVAQAGMELWRVLERPGTGWTFPVQH